MTGVPLRCAVVGVGRIGSLHAEVYARDPRTELVGVTDIDPATADRVAGSLEVTAYPDTDSLLRHTRPDIVSIAVPEQHRLAPAVAAARLGAHLLLEKPLSPSVDETDKLLHQLSGASGTVMVNFILRSDPRYLEVRDAVAQGRLGELCTLSARRRGTAAGAALLGPWTGLLISTAIHDIDVMTWIAGAPVERVYAEAVIKQSAQWGHEDAVLATLRFGNGCIGMVDTSWVLPATAPEPLSAGLQVVGTGGSAIVEGSNHGLSILDTRGLSYPDLAHWPSGSEGVGGSLGASIRRFIDCVMSGKPPVVGLREARAAEAVVAALRQSIRDGRPVDLPQTP